MKFLIDAQLPLRLAFQLRQAGFEAIHTLDLPDGNRTTDQAINELSIKEHHIVVTKDSDFVESFFLRRTPETPFSITGNISNASLESLFSATIRKLADGFDTFDFIEIERANLIFHL